MKKSKIRIIFNVLFFVFIIIVIIYNEQITTYIINNYIYNKNAVIEIKNNEYSLRKNYETVQITDNFIAHDYQHLLNIMYTILDSGNEEFYFYCSDEYKDCLSDIDRIIPSNNNSDNNYDILSDINNLVHPYNTYKKLTVVMNNYGKVIVRISKQYNDKQIEYINNEIEKFKSEQIKNEMSDKEKIKLFHDYIINTTRYDKERANNMNSKEYKNSESHTAIGLLRDHVSLCGGYSDVMSIYISSLNIPNIRISADKHVWNLVFINNNWYHLDATWDDPVTNTGSQILVHDYFLIDSDTLFKNDNIEHNFNKVFYKEANYSSNNN